MAIDANILLRGISPDIVGAADRGFQLGQRIKQAPLRNQLLELQNQRQEQAIQMTEENSQRLGRQEDRGIQDQQRQEKMRTVGAQALSVLQQPAELRQQALSGLMVQAEQAGDTEAFTNLGQLMQMDNVGLESSLKNIVFKAGESLPGGAASLTRGAGLVKRVQSVHDLGGNTARVFFNDGTVKLVTGTDAENAIVTAAQDKEIDFQTRLAAGKSGGGVSGKIAAEAETAETAAETAGTIEAGKQAKILEFAPRITKAKRLSTSAADDAEKLSALRANLPLVNEMAGKLRALSSDATHTFGGKAFNFLAKESGFGATKGSTARASYQAIIDNQVLPLLKATFGAAFTAAEGERLAATLGDANAAPAEKMAQLDAFISSQNNQISALERKSDPSIEPQVQPSIAPEPAAVQSLSDEELFQ